MKYSLICLSLAGALTLTGCEGASHGWGKNRDTEFCKFFNSCDESCGLYGNCKDNSDENEKKDPVKPCEMYGNCSEY